MSEPSRTARYTQAVEHELESGHRREPVWQEACAAAGGDERAARARYVQLRVEQILADEDEREQVRQDRRKQRRFLDSLTLTTAQKNALLGLGIIVILVVGVILLLRK